MEQEDANKKKIRLYKIVGILLVAHIAVRLISGMGFEQTSVLFIGLPTLITLLVIKYSKTPKTGNGSVFKTITLFLLMASIFLGEGLVCILMAAPLFYSVAGIFVLADEYFKNKKNSKLYSFLLFPVVILLSQPLEIINPSEIQTVETFALFQKEVSIDAFNKHPDFLKDYPTFFKIGFPKPVEILGTGTNIGDTRAIRFKSTTKGIGTLSLEIIDKTDTSIVFKPVHDDTHIDHWLTWKQMKVEFIKIDSTQTKIKWTSQYHCDLGPSWYFEPLEELAVDIMNKHLINAYFN